MNGNVLVFADVDPAVPEAAELMSALDSDLGARYPGALVQESMSRVSALRAAYSCLDA